MAPIQKSMRTLELGEGVEEPMLKYKEDRDRRQGGRGNAYSLYQNRPPIIGMEKR